MNIRGAIYYNGFSPGFIGVVPNSAFTVRVNGVEAMLHIVRHVSPVVVTDFGNDFVSVEKDGKHFTSLKRPIDAMPTNAIGASFTAVDGLEPREFLCTKEHDYAIYRKSSFTEITVGEGPENVQDPNSVSAAIFNRAIDSFLEIYRLVTRDVWVLRPDRLQQNVPVIRTAAVAYGTLPGQTKQQRLAGHIPRHFQPIVFSVQEYAADTPALRHAPRQVTQQLGHFLAIGTRLTDAHNALLDCFEMLQHTRNFRFALVESFSIAEVISFDHIGRLRRADVKLDQALRRKEKKGFLTMGDLIQSFFPKLFARDLARFPDLIKDLELTRKLRNATLHEGKRVEVTDAERALNAVQRLIFAIEEPSWASK